MRSKIDGLGGHNVPMHLTARHEFSAPCDRVYAMSTDPVFLDQACRDLGALSQTVEVVPGDGATTRVSMVAETVPALRTLAGGTLTIGQELTWGPAVPDGSRTGRMFIKLAGLPVTLDAEVSLAPAASGCTVDYSGELVVAVPLLGPALEKQATPFVTETLDAQQASGNRWLAEHP